MNLLGNETDTIPSTGRVDSVLVSYDDLRIVNSKLIELEYERQINEKFRNIVINDSIAIDNLKCRIYNIQRDSERRLDKIKTQRNVAGGVGIVSLFLLIISLL